MSVLRSDKLPQELNSKEAFDWFRGHEFQSMPPYFLTHWKTNKRFFLATGSLMAFEETSQGLVIAGEPLVLDSHLHLKEDSIKAFVNWARRLGKGTCGYYVGSDWQSSEFRKINLGTTTRYLLQSFDIENSQSKELRRALRKGQGQNFEIVPMPLKNQKDSDKVVSLYKRWRSSRFAMELGFLLSPPTSDFLASDFEEWYGVEKEGELVGFCSLLPFKQNGELSFYMDNIIHDPDREPFALSFLISFLIESLSKKGIYELNFGLNPFARAKILDSPLMEKVFSLLYRVPFGYRAKGLHFFKKKFGGTEEPAFCFFGKDDNSWLQLANLAQVTLKKNKKGREYS